MERSGAPMVLASLGVLSALAAPAWSAVTFSQPVRSASVTTSADGQTQTAQGAPDLSPFAADLSRTVNTTVDGQPLANTSLASISCIFDPEGVKGRCRLEGTGRAGAQNSVSATSTFLLDVVVTTTDVVPYEIRGDAVVFTQSGQSALAVSLTSLATGQRLFDSATAGSETVRQQGLLMPGSYRFVYDARLVANDGHGERDLVLRFDVGCPADMDDGLGLGHADGAVDINDLLFFMGMYVAGDEEADVDDGSGLGVPDFAVDVNDLLYFVARYAGGC